MHDIKIAVKICSDENDGAQLTTKKDFKMFEWNPGLESEPDLTKRVVLCLCPVIRGRTVICEFFGKSYKLHPSFKSKYNKHAFSHFFKFLLFFTGTCKNTVLRVIANN